MAELHDLQRNSEKMDSFSNGKDALGMDLGLNGCDSKAAECQDREEDQSKLNSETRGESSQNVVIEMGGDDQGLPEKLEEKHQEVDREYDDDDQEEEEKEEKEEKEEEDKNEEEEEEEDDDDDDDEITITGDSSILNSKEEVGSSTFSNAQADEALFRGLEEGKSPLWIKWRGKWQAGIQCCLEDCPAQTVKAMPTYGRKSYIVVFFPSNRSFVWTDWQLACSIAENPEPLSHGSHESGRQSVLDLNAAKAYMFHKITALMLDISDQLPITAVEEVARNVNFWKEFANSTAKSATYQELGTTLVKLKSIILPSLFKEDWIGTCSVDWEHKCRNAGTAGSLEILIKELKGAICWKEVSKLWDGIEEENIGSEWKSLTENFQHDMSNRGKAWYSTSNVTVHGRKFDASDVENTESEQYGRQLKLDHGMSLKLEPRKNLEISSRSDVTANSNIGVSDTKAVRRSSQCLAFSSRKGRQCNRYPKEGSVYCCMHGPSNDKEGSTPATEQKKGKHPIAHSGEAYANGVLCSGVTKYGKRCSHKARNGSVFCLKHMLRDLDNPGRKATEKSVIVVSESGIVESQIGTQHDVSNQENGDHSSFSVTGNRRTFDASDCSPERNGHSESGDKESEQDSKRMKVEQSLVLYSGDTPKTTLVQLVSSSSDAIFKTPNSGLKSANDTSVHEAKNVRRSSQCLAFSDRKGRQCNRYPKEGSVYCCMHLPSSYKEQERSTNEQKKYKLPISNSNEDDPHGRACSGLTKYGKRCAHKARNGSVFCLKHTRRDNKEPVLNDSEKTVILSLAAITKSTIVTPSEHNVSSKKQKIEQADAGESSSSVHDMSNCVPNLVARNGDPTQCIGLCGSGVRCSHRAKPGFPYCEKHVPGLSPYANRGQEKSHFKDASGRILSRKEEFKISRLKDIVHEYMGARLYNEEGESSQHTKSKQQIIDTVFKEVSGNLKALESLYEIVTGEMENLKKILEDKNDLQVQNSIVPILTDGVKAFECLSNMELPKQVNAAPNDDISRYRCKLCAQEFSDLVSLSEHWRCYHKKEAQQYFRGYTCQFCNHPFTNKKALYRHRNARHADMVNQTKPSLLAPCIICNAQFLHFEDLWKHVVRSHPDQLCALWPVSDSSATFMHRSVQSQTSGLESVNATVEKLVEIRPKDSKNMTIVHEGSKGTATGYKEKKDIAISLSEDKDTAITHEKDATVAREQNRYPAILHAETKVPAVVQEENKGPSIALEENRGTATAHEQKKDTTIVQEENKVTATTEAMETSSDTAEMRYKCKICGLKFPHLPDLGRHHQAHHKPTQSIHLSEMPFPMGLPEQVKPIVGLEKEKKKKAQKLNVRRAPLPKVNTEAQITEKNVRNWSIEEIMGHTGAKFESFPSNEDILTVARLSCCKNQLYSVLEKKYASLPERLALKAAQLCSNANVQLQFDWEGYVCPNGCKKVSLSTDIKTSVEGLSNAKSLPRQPQFNSALTGYASALTSSNIMLDESHVVFTTVTATTITDNSCSKMILCEDLSFGKERMPIPCVLDKDVMGECKCSICLENPSNHLETLTPWLHFSYVTKRTLDPSLEIDTESSRLGCSCQEHQCLPTKCEHVYLFDNDYTDAEDIFGRPMAQRFPYDDKGCIILQEGHLVYECNSLCNCSELCQNRVLQKGVQVKLEVYKTRHKGWAVRAAQYIPRGTFVCEYIGEVLDDFEANRRGERYDKEGCSYLYDIDAHIHMGRRGRPKPFVIDATKSGNVARFINHSCSPNLVNYQVLVESMDCQLAHIGLYANRDINIGEELAYDYRYKLLPGRGCPCHCGAKDCRGRLY